MTTPSDATITARFFRWIDAHGITRTQAAAALGVDERSLSTYRSRGLPRRQHARAEQIMATWQDPAAGPAAANRLNIPFADDELDAIRRAAAIVGEPDLLEFIRRAVNHRARDEITKTSGLKVAEEPAPYRTKRDGTNGGKP